MNTMENETIAAIATPFGSGGIGIIRISGPHALTVAGNMFQHTVSIPVSEKNIPLAQLDSHHLNHGYIVDDQRVVDEVLLAVMKAPHSYTKEDVVEIQSHSGPVVLTQILKLTLQFGARLAEPGEFTKRAYLNGRIDLSQAEAVADTIAAKSESALNISTSQLLGVMKQSIENLMQRLNTIMAQLEAGIEFGDEVQDDFQKNPLIDALTQKVILPTRRMVSQYEEGHFLRDGIRMDIVGRPNVGKSSLLNRLLQKDRAIVTDLPGTTRDLIEDCFSISGIPIIITDTAGLHVTENPVEIIGIQKTHDNIERSDLVLFVVDGSQPILESDLEIYDKIHAKKVILIVNKSDLVHKDQDIKIPERIKLLPFAKISALHGDGIDGLKSIVAELCTGGVEIDPGRTIIPNMRQKIALDLALAALERSLSGFQNAMDDELILEDLKSAHRAFGQIIGQDVDTDILDEIFSQFCIGK